MAVNGYFQLICEDGKTWFQAFPPAENGEMFSFDEVIRYFDAISFSEFELTKLDQYIKDMDFSLPLLLFEREIFPETEKCFVTVCKQGEYALARFYPPAAGGTYLSENDIIDELKKAGICHGIRRKAIEHFLQNHEYARDYRIAEATMPVQGYSAKIQYFFDINTTARPKLNEDGSVDFHQLGNIKGVKKGDKLATLTPAYRGKKGISVLGHPLMPKKVKDRRLRFGRNIALSENHCHIYSEVEGHVTLVEDMVMVSDVYRVPANVDSSTGDIDYNGTVEVAGNVTTGFTIKAEGDIVVNGVVEGATLISGGNIVLKRGMQGMDRGILEAEGNITAKFLENCKVKCKGELNANAILHSEVFSREKVTVLGRKGQINGGRLETYSDIEATSLGSNMGASTKIEILSDKDLIVRMNDLKERIEEATEMLEKIEKVVSVVKMQVEKGQEILSEQKEYLKRAALEKPKLQRNIHNDKEERERLLKRIQKNKRACIKAKGVVHPGVDITIKDARKICHEEVSYCRFVREGADVKMTGL